MQPRQVVGALRFAIAPKVRRVEVGGEPPPLAVSRAAVPFLAAPAHARYDGSRRLRLLNREVECADGVDWDREDQGPLWAFHLHQFDYARDRALSAQCRGDLVLDWIDRHRDGVGWKLGPISLRALCWIKLLLTPGALDLSSADGARMRASLASQLETLDRQPEVRLLANHYLSNLLALVAAGIAFRGPRADVWLRRVAEFRAQLDEQVPADGMHFERSPMYHSLLLENVLDLANLLASVPDRAPSGLEATVRAAAARMLGALDVVTHPDDEIALLGDSAFGIAHPPAELRAFAARLGIEARPAEPPGVLERAGIVRLAEGSFSLLASVAGPMPSYQPGHAHCDALSFELCIDSERIVTDTGVCEYVVGDARDRSRATASHATVEIGERDQAELWAAHRIGGRPEVRVLDLVPGRRIEASCAGWATRGCRHRRVFELGSGRLAIRDSLEGRSARARFCLPLAPGLVPRLAEGRAVIDLAGGRRLRVELPEGVRWKLESAPYFPEFGRKLERSALVGRADAPTSVSWGFELES